MPSNQEKALLSRANAIVATARSEGRNLSPNEAQIVNGIVRGVKDGRTLDRKISEMGAAMSSPVGGESGGLFGAIQAAGFDRQSHPSVVVPISTFESSATSTSSPYNDVAQFMTSPALGAGSRFLYPSLPRVDVDPDVTSVSSFRQKTRTLPTLSAMIRDIDETSTKPETATQSELVNSPLKQIATVESGVPNIMLESASFRGWINDDLSFAYSSAVDAHVIAQIVAEAVPLQTWGLNLLETFAKAVETVRTAGYNPTVLAASPEDLLTLSLSKEPTAGSYIAQKMDHILSGIRKVAVHGLHATGLAWVLDPQASGTFHTSQIRVAAFEENSGKSNTSTVRIESNGLFLVQRLGAICEIATGS